MVITREDKLFMFCITAFVFFMVFALFDVGTGIAGGTGYLFYLLGIPFFLAYYRFGKVRVVARWLIFAALIGSLLMFDFANPGQPFLSGAESPNLAGHMLVTITLLLCIGISLLFTHRVTSIFAILTSMMVSGFLFVSRESVFLISVGGGFPVTLLEAYPLFGQGSELFYLWRNVGIFGLLGFGLLLGIPIYNLYWAINHPDRMMRFHGIAGVAFVTVFFFMSLFAPVISNLYTGSIYVLGVMLFWAELRAREDAWLVEKKQRLETISVGVICKNEADRIGACLSSVVEWADEIVVLDSGSIDETVTEARKFTDKVYETDWPGYGPQKRRAVEKCTKDWVLSIDADEIVTERLKQEIDGVLSGGKRYDGFKFSWRSEIFGGTVDFGADGRRHLRLFRRGGAAEFSHDVVHEGVVSVARVRILHGIVIHKTFRNYAHLMNKFMFYAVLQSEARYKWGRRASVYEAALRGLFSFLSLYFYRLGLLDGWRGLLMAGLYSQYTFNKYAALWVRDVAEAENGGEKAASAESIDSP